MNENEALRIQNRLQTLLDEAQAALSREQNNSRGESACRRRRELHLCR